MPLSRLPKARRRGAQPGNNNALQHGFYSSRFKPSEHHDLDSCTELNLTDEINMLRVSIRRVFELFQDNTDPSLAITFLRAISLASLSITRLARTQNVLKGDSNELLDALNIALEDVTADIKCAQPHTE